MKTSVRHRLESAWSVWDRGAEAFIRFSVHVLGIPEADVRAFLDEPAHPEDDDDV
jgi:hypothetical protein